MSSTAKSGEVDEELTMSSTAKSGEVDEELTMSSTAKSEEVGRVDNVQYSQVWRGGQS